MTRKRQRTQEELAEHSAAISRARAAAAQRASQGSIMDTVDMSGMYEWTDDELPLSADAEPLSRHLVVPASR